MKKQIKNIILKNIDLKRKRTKSNKKKKKNQIIRDEIEKQF
jgi:hypothetical protein